MQNNLEWCKLAKFAKFLYSILSRLGVIEKSSPFRRIPPLPPRLDRVKGDLATETNEDNDFTTVIHIVIILCFIEHLCYPQGPAEMLGNISILME